MTSKLCGRNWHVKGFSGSQRGVLALVTRWSNPEHVLARMLVKATATGETVEEMSRCKAQQSVKAGEALAEQRVFNAVVGKEAGWWNIWVPEIDHVTSTRKSRKIAGYTRTLIAAVLGIPEASFRVERELVTAEEFERRYTAAVRGTDAQEKL